MWRWASRALLFAVVCSLIFWASVMGVMTSDRTMPVTVLSSTVLTPEVPQGGLLRVAYSVYRLRACRTLIERVILDADGNRIILPDLDFESAGPSGADGFTSPTVVPLSAAIGPAKYRVTLSYSCNVVHRIFWPIVDQRPDIPFVVTPAKVKESRYEPETPFTLVPTSIADASATGEDLASLLRTGGHQRR